MPSRGGNPRQKGGDPHEQVQILPQARGAYAGTGCKAAWSAAEQRESMGVREILPARADAEEHRQALRLHGR